MPVELRRAARDRGSSQDFRAGCHGGKPVKLDVAALRDHPLPPVVDGDKDSKGRLLVIAGSRQVPGAALLTATAAMRAGAGKLRIATAASIATAVAIAMPEAMVIALPE